MGKTVEEIKATRSVTGLNFNIYLRVRLVDRMDAYVSKQEGLSRSKYIARLINADLDIRNA